MASRAPEYCCPLCKGDLEKNGDAYHCGSCARDFPVVLGIPDFRVFPDPYIDYADDHQKARVLLKIAEKENCRFEELVRLYWKITPHVPADLTERYIRGALAAAARGEAALEKIAASTGGGLETMDLIELGCGTGGFLTAAARRAKSVVGVDIAFRWLVIARKRLEENGLDVPLVCACAEHLPFKPGAFDLAMAESLIDHVKDQPAVFSEIRRILKPGGSVHLTTTNRFSIALEPHVGVWGVGFLPRCWMNAYVQWAKGIPYKGIKQLSRFELARLLSEVGLAEVRFDLPAIPADVARSQSWMMRVGIAVFDILRRIPGVKSLLLLITPLFEITAKKCGPEADRR